MYGIVVGRFFLNEHLRIHGDDTPDTATLSELLETFPLWEKFVKENPYFGHKQLFTMFETSDVHPDVIEAMKHFDRVIVPYDYLKEILISHGVNAHSINYYSSPLILDKYETIPTTDSSRKVFLYVGTNDKRKNLLTLVRTFIDTFGGTRHLLIVKTNTSIGIPESDNVRIVLGKVPLKTMANLYNTCDYVISFTRGEGVGLPMLEANHFGKPIICHDKGVFRDVKKQLSVPWHVLPATEVPIDLSGVPPFLRKVFYGTWWEVDVEESKKILRSLVQE